MAKLSALLLLVAITACGPNNHKRPGGGGDDDSTVDSGNQNTVDAPACATSVVKADKIPLDLYVMLDQSGSMSDSVSAGGTKWSTVTSALGTFLQQPGLDGVSVGIQYFGVPPSGGTCSTATCSVDADCGGSACGPCFTGICLGALATGDSCNAADYATPSVEIAPLPGVATQIVSSMNAHSPTTGTPTSAALQGTVDHAKAWKQSHPGDAVVAVLATDGDPGECDTSLPNINAIAAAALAGTPSI